MSALGLGLEELDQVPRGVFDQDLLPANSADDGVAIPAAGFRYVPVGHRLRRTSRPTYGIESQSNVAAGHDRETGSGLKGDGESKVFSEEGNGLLNVSDDIANVRRWHCETPSQQRGDHLDAVMVLQKSPKALDGNAVAPDHPRSAQWSAIPMARGGDAALSGECHLQ